MPDLERDKWKNRTKTRKCSLFQGFEERFYYLSMNGKNTPYFTILSMNGKNTPPPPHFTILTQNTLSEFKNWARKLQKLRF